jgi:hypothetical protein
MALREKTKVDLTQAQLQAAERQVAKNIGLPVGQLRDFTIFKDTDHRVRPSRNHESGVFELIDATGDLICCAQFHDMIAHLCSVDECGELDSDYVFAMLTKKNNGGYANLFIGVCRTLVSVLGDGGITFSTDEGNYSYSIGDIKKIERLVSKIHEAGGTS